jgi:competence protein ComEC
VNGITKFTPLRIVVPVILGIIFILFIEVDWPVGNILLVSLFCLFSLLAAYNFLLLNFKFRWVSGLLANIALFVTGIFMVSAVDHRNKLLLKETGDSLQEIVLLCKMEARPVAKARISVGNAVVIAKMDSLGYWHPAQLNILVYFKNDSLCELLACGDLIMVTGALQTIQAPQNPYMFSFKRYLHNRHVFYQVFPEAGHWISVGMANRDPIRQYAEICRGKFMETLIRFKIEGQDFALATALLLGTKDFLENDTRQEFSHAGAMHVLCVSGLHVGIMYVLAEKMLFFLNRGRKSRKVQSVLILVCIWAYAFITGLSPSVMRAALMFSLIASARLFKRSSENYNLLAVAAFIQLWIDPYEITQVGFQLSYLAVLGIFAFYKPINELFNAERKLIAWVWSILAVSVAAQLATFPLASHYFNLFPVYFLLTNLIVVPLAGVIIYLAAGLLLAGAAGLTIEWMAFPLKWSLRLMQSSVEIIQSWPGAVIESIIISPLQVVLIYIAIIALFAFSVLAYRKWAFVFLGSFLLLSVTSILIKFDRLNHKEIIVYQVNGHKAIDLLDHRKAIFVCDSLLTADQGKIDFQVKPNRMHKGIKNIEVINTLDKASFTSPGAWINFPFIFFRGKSMAFIDNQWKSPSQGKIIQCDLAVISGNPRITPDSLSAKLKVGQIIIDSSVPFYKAGLFMDFFINEGIPCHSVRHDGAFVLKWQN